MTWGDYQYLARVIWSPEKDIRMERCSRYSVQGRKQLVGQKMADVHKESQRLRQFLGLWVSSDCSRMLGLKKVGLYTSFQKVKLLFLMLQRLVTGWN